MASFSQLSGFAGVPGAKPRITAFPDIVELRDNRFVMDQALLDVFSGVKNYAKRQVPLTEHLSVGETLNGVYRLADGVEDPSSRNPEYVCSAGACNKTVSLVLLPCGYRYAITISGWAENSIVVREDNFGFTNLVYSSLNNGSAVKTLLAWLESAGSNRAVAFAPTEISRGRQQFCDSIATDSEPLYGDGLPDGVGRTCANTPGHLSALPASPSCSKLADGGPELDCYQLMRSGVCPHATHSPVTSQDGCVVAASVLSLSAAAAGAEADDPDEVLNERPEGCYLSTVGRGSTLHFNGHNGTARVIANAQNDFLALCRLIIAGNDDEMPEETTESPESPADGTMNVVAETQSDVAAIAGGVGTAVFLLFVTVYVVALRRRRRTSVTERKTLQNEIANICYARARREFFHRYSMFLLLKGERLSPWIRPPPTCSPKQPSPRFNLMPLHLFCFEKFRSSSPGPISSRLGCPEGFMRPAAHVNTYAYSAGMPVLTHNHRISCSYGGCFVRYRYPHYE